MGIWQKIRSIGPGAMVAAAFIGPGTVTTATIAGASYGYTLLWAIAFSILATLLLQEMSARLGLISGMGVGTAIRHKLQGKLAFIFAAILIIGAILIGNAAYEAGNITGAVLGFERYTERFAHLPVNPLVLIIGTIAFVLLFSGAFRLIERSLVMMVSVMGVVFLLSAILLKPDLGQIIRHMFIPELPDKALLAVLGLIGTTVVPYNLFLHASSVKQRWKDPAQLATARWDTILSVAMGGVITMAILVTSAAAFDGQTREVNSAADLAMQLTPILGDWSSLFIAIGFLAAGLSSSVTAPLAAAFATSETLGWGDDLKGLKFRIIWLFVLLCGIVFSSLGIRPTHVILFAQVANGLLLPVVAVFLLWIMNDPAIMGAHRNKRRTNILGILVVAITFALGLKGILSAAHLL